MHECIDLWLTEEADGRLSQTLSSSILEGHLNLKKYDKNTIIKVAFYFQPLYNSSCKIMDFCGFEVCVKIPSGENTKSLNLRACVIVRPESLCDKREAGDSGGKTEGRLRLAGESMWRERRAELWN